MSTRMLSARVVTACLIWTIIIGCGAGSGSGSGSGGGGGTQGGGSAAISVSINPQSPTAVSAGGTQTFTATVSNDSANGGVTWGASLGTITSNGVYTAPATIAVTSTTVIATSKTDPSKSASVTVPLVENCVGSMCIGPINPATASLGIGGSQSFSDIVTGDSTNSGVTWSITSGPGTLSGQTTTNVIYNAPTTPINSAASVTLTATGKAASSLSATATIALNPVSVAITQTPGSMNGGTSQNVIATVANDGTNAGVTWTVTGGGSFSPSTTASGVATSFTAPTPTSTSSVTVTATSKADPSKSASTVISIAPIVAVTLTSPSAITLDGDGVSTSTIAATITGDSSGLGATFAVSGSGGTLSRTSAAGNTPSTVYTAPNLSTSGSSTVTITSAADHTKTQSVTVTLNAPMIFTTAPGALTAGAPSTAYPSTAIGVLGGTGTKTFSLFSGALPAGLAISSSGVITGTPTGTPGTSTFTVQVTDQASTPGVLKGTFTITIAIPPVVWQSPTAGSYSYSVGTAITPIALSATGGTGAITYSVNSGTLPQGLQIVGNQVTGTPTVTTSGTPITFLATDSSSPTAQTAVSPSVTLVVNPSAVLALPAPTPSSLGTAGINLAYNGSINATGGTGGYTWTVNNVSVPTNGSAVALSDGLSVTNNGSATLVVSGTPTATGSVPLVAAVKDSTNATAGPIAYNLTVSNVYTVGGGVNLPVCSPSPFSFSGITIKLYTSPLQQPLQQPLQTATTLPDGSFSFANVPNGTYVLVPSATNAVFSPATENVTVSGGNLSAGSFTATLGYSVSGTISYSGIQTGQIYIAAVPGNNCYIGSTGTSISAPGTFIIHGVPPGTYTLQAFMDTGANGGNGVPNADNPIGSTPGVTVTTSDVSSVAVTLNDPAPVTLATAPTLTQVSGMNQAALIQFVPITSGGVETANAYILQYSTTPNFSTFSQKQFFANGTHNNYWLLHGLTNGSSLYFRAYGASNGTATGPFSPVFGPVTISAPTVGNTVTGTVSFTNSNAPNLPGPMYIGFLDQGTGAFYGQYFPGPQSVQPYSIQVPSGSDYLFLGIVDQNNDGVVNANDVTNTGNGSSQPIVVVSGTLSNNNLNLPSTNGIATVTTQAIQSIVSSTTTQSYALRFHINGLIKLPVAVRLVSGPNLITPVDIAICGGSGSNCAQGFQVSFNLNVTSPNAGDAYTFDVTYSDGTSDVLTASVTAVLSGYATGLSPQTGLGSSVTPTFTWTDPFNPGSYAYQFQLTDSNNHILWQIPGSAVASNGFSSAITSIQWGTDPTGGGSTPSVGSLTLNSLYDWQIAAQDSYGNQSVTQVQYQP